LSKKWYNQERENMRVRIEKIRKRDLPAFYSLFKKALLEDFKEYSPEVAEFQWKRHRKSNLLRWVKQGEEYLFAAKDKKGKVVGILASQRIVGGVSHCDWLIVSKEHRGQGIGKRLLSFWENWVKRNKGHMLTVSCSRRNLGYYKKLGFKKYGYLQQGYFGENDYELFKRIGEFNKKSLKV